MTTTSDRETRMTMWRAVELADADPRDSHKSLCAALLLDKFDRESDAIGYYERALREGLDSGDQLTALVCLASSHRNVGDTNKGLRVLRRARRLFKSDPVVEAFYGILLYDSGEAAAAVRTLGRALLVSTPAVSLHGFGPTLRTKFAGVGRRKQ